MASAAPEPRLRPPFLAAEAFRESPAGYQLLPFRFLRWSAEEALIINDVGEFLFLPLQDLRDLVEHRLERSHPAYRRLAVGHFLRDSTSTVPLHLLATKFRTKKSFLAGFTQLHLFVVTLRCDHSCRYCQVSRVVRPNPRFDMSEATALRAVELMFQSPSRVLKVEFQGGEPLLHFERIRTIVAATLERDRDEQRDIEFVVATNLAPLTDEMLAFFAEHRFLISTSLDGPRELHDANRPRPGRGSHELTLENLSRARAALGHDRVGALMTTTERSLAQPREIVDEYVASGFDSIFLRSVSPYGFAVRTGEAQRYQAEQFLEFYAAGLERVIEWNRAGTPIVEVFAQIVLRKILTPFATGYVDLQSPAGAGIGAVAYNYDGDVYASDEARMLAEMGDQSFRLGNVHLNSYREIFGGEVVRGLLTHSVLESLPGCSDCAFLPYCGADPVFHHRTQGDLVGHRPTSAFCTRNLGVFRLLFDYLRSGDDFVRALFLRWATDCDPGPEESDAP